MSISSTTSKNTYNGNGITTVFAYTFRILDDDEILVQLKNTSTGVLTTQVKTTNYTVSGVGESAGGNITFLVSPASGNIIVLTRNAEFLQPDDYNEYDAFPAATLETDLDRVTILAQQLKEGLDRSIKIDSAVSGVTVTLPTPVASKLLAWNSGATAIEYVVGTDLIESYVVTGTTGVLAVTGPSTASLRTLTGTSNEITVLNGTGVSGDPTFSLPTALTFTGKTITGGTFSSPTLTTPTLTTPVLGVATATTINKVTITAPAAGSTLTIQNGFTLTVSGTATISTTPITAIVIQQFTTVGANTYTPTPGMVFCISEAIGSGAGGGGVAQSTGQAGGGGGGAGSYARVRLTAAQVGASQVATIGAIGAGGTAGANNGSNGSDCSLGTLCVGKGGTGGGGASANSPGASGAGGVAGTGTVLVPGGHGSYGFSGTITTVGLPGGQGGQGYFGGGLPSVVNSITGTGETPSVYGNGGNGGRSFNNSAAAAGGPGSLGIVIVTEFIAV